MQRWAKVTESIQDSEDWAALCEADPEAANIYVMAWVACDVYAIIPAGTPRLFKARVCPLFKHITDERAEDIMALWEARKLAVRYADSSGRRLLWLPRWHAHNGRHVNWTRISSPAHELPKAWEMPGTLRDFIIRNRNGSLAQFFREHAPGLLPYGTRRVPRAKSGAKNTTTVGGNARGPKKGDNARDGTKQTETTRERPSENVTAPDVDLDTDTVKDKGLASLPSSEGKAAGVVADAALRERAPTFCTDLWKRTQDVILAYEKRFPHGKPVERGEALELQELVKDHGVAQVRDGLTSWGKLYAESMQEMGITYIFKGVRDGAFAPPCARRPGKISGTPADPDGSTYPGPRGKQ